MSAFFAGVLGRSSGRICSTTTRGIASAFISNAILVPRPCLWKAPIPPSFGDGNLEAGDLETWLKLKSWRTYCGWLRNPAPVDRYFVPLFIFIYRVLTCFNHPRWCRISSINSRCKLFRRTCYVGCQSIRQEQARFEWRRWEWTQQTEQNGGVIWTWLSGTEPKDLSESNIDQPNLAWLNLPYWLMVSWDDDPIWLSYFSGGLKPPTSTNQLKMGGSSMNFNGSSPPHPPRMILSARLWQSLQRKPEAIRGLPKPS